MNGIISLKPSCPMYNTRLRSNKILKQGKTTFTTRIISNKIDRILPTSSKVHIDSISPVLASKQLLKHPFLHHVIVPVAGSIASTIAVWKILPMIFIRFHEFLTETILLPLGLGSVPFEKSVLRALEVSVKYPVTFMAYLRVCKVIGPTKLASLTFPLLWRVAVKLSILLFFHQLKRNVITRIVDSRVVMRDRLLVVDKVNSVAMFSLGCLVICDAFGDATQSILETILFATSFLMAYIIVVDNHKAENSFQGIVYQSPDEGLDMVAKVTAEIDELEN